MDGSESYGLSPHPVHCGRQQQAWGMRCSSAEQCSVPALCAWDLSMSTALADFHSKLRSYMWGCRGSAFPSSFFFFKKAISYVWKAADNIYYIRILVFQALYLTSLRLSYSDTKVFIFSEACHIILFKMGSSGSSVSFPEPNQ